MRVLRGILIALIGGLPAAALATESSLKEFLPAYISIQEALSTDNFNLAQEKARDLQKQVQNNKALKDVNASLNPLLKAKSIADARKEFKKLSAPFVKWVEQAKEPGFDVVYCPMAGAKWVQKQGQVANPYFGREMLHCGEKAS